MQFGSIKFIGDEADPFSTAAAGLISFIIQC